MSAAPTLGGGKGILALAVPDDDEEGDGDERDSFDAFAAAAGIPDGRRDAAYEALRSMIESCAAKIKEGKYGSED